MVFAAEEFSVTVVVGCSGLCNPVVSVVLVLVEVLIPLELISIWG